MVAVFLVLAFSSSWFVPPAAITSRQPTKPENTATPAARAQASIAPVTSPDPASWRPPADVEKLAAQLRGAPWMPTQNESRTG